MTRKITRAETAGQVIDSARKGDLVRSAHEELLFQVETLIDTLEHAETTTDGNQVLLEADDRDTMVTMLRELVTMPISNGAPPTRTEEDKDADREAWQFWHAEMGRLKKEGVPAPDARDRTARAIKKRWPKQNQNRSPKTIAQRFARRDPPD